MNLSKKKRKNEKGSPLTCALVKFNFNGIYVVTIRLITDKHKKKNSYTIIYKYIFNWWCPHSNFSKILRTYIQQWCQKKKSFFRRPYLKLLGELWQSWKKKKSRSDLPACDEQFSHQITSMLRELGTVMSHASRGLTHISISISTVKC